MWYQSQRLTSASGRSITFLIATVMFLDFQSPFHTCPYPPLPTRSKNSRSANSGEVIRKSEYNKYSRIWKWTPVTVVSSNSVLTCFLSMQLTVTGWKEPRKEHMGFKSYAFDHNMHVIKMGRLITGLKYHPCGAAAVKLGIKQGFPHKPFDLRTVNCFLGNCYTNILDAFPCNPCSIHGNLPVFNS